MEAGRILIDTSLLIEHLRARDKVSTVLARLQDTPRELVTTSIVAAELYFGARTEEKRTHVQNLLSPIAVLSFTHKIAIRMSLEAQRLRSRNAIIGFRDLAIASAALQFGIPIATRNRSEFERIEGLEVLDLTLYS